MTSEHNDRPDPLDVQHAYPAWALTEDHAHHAWRTLRKTTLAILIALTAAITTALAVMEWMR